MLSVMTKHLLCSWVTEGEAVAACALQASGLCVPRAQLARPNLQMHLRTPVTPAVCHGNADRLAGNYMRQVVRSPAFTIGDVSSSCADCRDALKMM